MDFEHILETIQFDFVLEGIGFLFGLLLLWQLFFQQKLSTLLTLFLMTL